jgi:hypothetical protein
MRLPTSAPGTNRSLSARPATDFTGLGPQLIDKILDWALGNAFYAGCYWACVADTGGWQECGPTCRKIEKDAKETVGL